MTSGLMRPLRAFLRALCGQKLLTAENAEASQSAQKAAHFLHPR